MNTVSPSAAKAALDRDKGKLVDVRTPAEFGEVHAQGALNVPLGDLGAESFPVAKDEPVYLLCRSGSRAAEACKKLDAAGFEALHVVEGGTDAWAAEGLPVVRGAKGVSLERQVRIAAGSLVLAGVVLGFAVHPGFFGVSAFVGAGLVFAGVTDTCGMAMLLAKMPWNRGAGCAGGSCSA
jgi:rhodanese-related sulfurtransferase